MASEAALSAEVACLEIEGDETFRQLREYAVAHELRAEHLEALQKQNAKSAQLCSQMMSQTTDMQKRLAAQQRKSLKLQESQHLVNATAKSWSYERKQLLQAAAAAEQMSREAVARQQVLEAEHANLAGEVEAERDATLEEVRLQLVRDLESRAKVTALRASQDTLREQFEVIQ